MGKHFSYSSTRRLGLLLNMAGVLILGLRYLKLPLPFFVKSWIMPIVPMWLCNIAWLCIMIGFFLQFISAK